MVQHFFRLCLRGPPDTGSLFQSEGAYRQKCHPFCLLLRVEHLEDLIKSLRRRRSLGKPVDSSRFLYASFDVICPMLNVLSYNMVTYGPHGKCGYLPGCYTKCTSPVFFTSFFSDAAAYPRAAMPNTLWESGISQLLNISRTSGSSQISRIWLIQTEPIPKE